MDNLLLFIINNCSFLYKEYGFKFIDSNVSESFDNASFIMKNTSLCLRFINERERISLEFGFVNKGKIDWYDIDIIRLYLTNKSRGTANLDPDNILFLAKQISKIQSIIYDTEIKHQLSDLKKKKG